MIKREDLIAVTRSLMLAENMGDVHDQINRLHDLLGLAQPEGNFLDGWEDEDMEALET